ncbi:hypothetical protein ACVIDN_002823 [Rhizobium brockwellii]
MAERKGGERAEIGAFHHLFTRAERCCDQQRLVVEDHLGLPFRPKRRFEIDLVAAEDRRPDENRLGGIDQPLAADRDQQHLFLADLRTIENTQKPGPHRSDEAGSAGRIMRTFLAEAVDQFAGIIDQRILHRIRGDDDDDEIAAIASLAQQHAWPAAAACRLMFRFFDDLGFFQLSGDRRDGGRRQPGGIGYFGMRERTVATQHGQHEHAVSLPDQLRARLGQHECRPLSLLAPPLVSTASPAEVSQGN